MEPQETSRYIQTHAVLHHVSFKSTYDFNKFLGRVEAGINEVGVNKLEVGINMYERADCAEMVQYRTPQSFFSINVCSFVAALYGEESLNAEKDEEIHPLHLTFDGEDEDGAMKCLSINIVGRQRVVAIAEKLSKDVQKVRGMVEMGKTDSLLKSYLQDNVHEFSINLLYCANHLTGIIANVKS